jgi:hypothetical protein
MPSKYDKKVPVMDRRQFIMKTAVTCSLAAGAGIWGYVFYSQEPVRRKDEKIYTFRDYRVEGSKLYPAIAIVHGKNAENMARAAIDKLGGIDQTQCWLGQTT